MRRGQDWYKRDPVAFLDGVQGMGPELIGAYAVILDLIYARGGETLRDDRHLAGVLGCSVRKARSLTEALIERGKLTVEGDWLTHERAKSQAKARREVSEARSEAGHKGGRTTAARRVKQAETSAKHSRNDHETVAKRARTDDETEPVSNDFNSLRQASASSKIQAEKRREETYPYGYGAERAEAVRGKEDQRALDLGESPTERSPESASDDDIAGVLWGRVLAYLVRDSGQSEARVRQRIGRWLKDGASQLEVCQAAGRAQRQGAVDPITFVEGILRASRRRPPGGGGGRSGGNSGRGEQRPSVLDQLRREARGPDDGGDTRCFGGAAALGEWR